MDNKIGKLNLTEYSRRLYKTFFNRDFNGDLEGTFKKTCLSLFLDPYISKI